MKSLTTRARLFGTIGLLVAALAIVGIIGYRSAHGLNEAMTYNYDNYFTAEMWLGEVISRQRAVNEEMLGAILRHSPESTGAAKTFVAESRARIKELLAQYEPTIVTPEERKLAEAFQHSRQQLVGANDAVLEALGSGNYDLAASLSLEKVRPLSQETMAHGDRLLEFQGKMAASLKEQSDRDFKSSSRLMEATMAIGVLVACLLGWLLSRSILRALSEATSVAERIAGGKLGEDIRIERDDEFGRLLRSLQVMDAKLVEVVNEVRRGASAVASAAGQLAQGNDDLSSRTQEQAAAIEETASSMEEMTATVKQNADNARQADQLAARARSQADSGGGVSARAVEAMSEINVASSRIADIIGVIDEIAFQTNLLALNAAVEAARAGEQGRGFAVVASEVRTLAQRSATAAKEIKDLISDSVGKVKAGSELVDRSGKALAEIVEGIKKVTDVVAEISSASQEQATGIDQVNNAITQMDETTQQNAALVEEASAASKAMEQQAQRLLQRVEFFRIGGDRPADRPAHPAVTTRQQQKVASVRALTGQSSVRTTGKGIPRETNPSRRESKPARSKPAVAAALASAPLARASGDESSWQEF